MVRVAVVGAGVAGLVTAKTLVECGIEDVIILEAQDRAGGRVWTVDSGNHVLELGAQWVHGVEGNPLCDLAISHSLIQPSATDFCKNESFMNDLTQFHLQDGTVIDPKIVREVEEVVDRIRSEGDAYYRQSVSQRPSNDSMYDFWQQKFEQYLESSTDTDHVKNVKKALSDWYERYEGGENACSGLSDLSLYLWGQYAGHGQLDWEWKSCYRSLLDILLTPVQDKIRFNTEVTSVILHQQATALSSSEMPGSHIQSQGTSSAVTLRCLNGTELSADHVVITLPLGVLRRKAEALFDPPLGQDKVLAMNALGFGATDKIYLIFNEPFWNESFCRINFVWANDSLEIVLAELQKHGLTNYENAQRPWWRAIEGFQRVRSHPNALCGWISGKAAEKMESETEEIVLTISWILLNCFFARKIPRPDTILRSQWSTNPYAYGSYTSIPPNATGKEMETLAEPIMQSEVPRILFAGEATDTNYFSTVGGAYASGLREANRLLEYMKKTSSTETTSQLCSATRLLSIY